MKILKNTVILIISLCLLFNCVGCGQEDELDSFEPVGVTVVESIGTTQFETNIDDPKIAKKMWDVFANLDINLDERGEMGSSYIYMCFYNEDQSTLAVFTIYENGVCCLGEDFSSFYKVYNGEDIYMQLLDIYTDYSPEK